MVGKTGTLFGSLLMCGLSAFAQAPTVSPTSLTFSYLVNSGKFPAAGKLTATLPASVPNATVMSVAISSTPVGWLTVTPTSGVSPLTMSVTVNPTSLSPGSYSATITVTNPTSPGYSTRVNVTLAITNPPSSLLVTSPTPGFDPLASGQTTPTITLNYTSCSGAGCPALPSAELSVSTTGDIVPFTVTTAVGKGSANWLRVNNGGLPSTSTSGVAAAGSNVKISVTLDASTLATLDAIPYTGTVTISAVNSANGTYPVNFILNAFAGTPKLTSIFPSKMPAFPATPAVKPLDPVITLNGDNFFPSSSKVFMAPPGGSNYPLTTVWVSRQILTATIPAAYLAPPMSAPSVASVDWTVTVINGAPGNNPGNGGATSAGVTFSVTDPALPSVQSVVNAASYLPSATQLPPNSANPVPVGQSAISPRGIISIFGQNLGPSSVVSATPTGPTLTYPTTMPGYGVAVDVTAACATGSTQAPLIMISESQVNAIVPDGLSGCIGTSPPPVVTITVNNGINSVDYTEAVAIAADPGVFTFGGNGQGQAAVLNFDAATGAVTVNGAKTPAPRGSAIEIFATGMGQLALPASGTPLADGEVATGPNKLLDDSFRVLIDGQSAPVFYAGTAGNGVAGLAQINAIVPPNARTGAAIPITVEIGAPDATGAITARRSQTGVTIAVK